MVRAVNAPLEQTEKTFNRVRGDALSIFVPHVLVRSVVDLRVLAICQGTMQRRGAIGHHVGIFSDHFLDNGLKILGRYPLYVPRADIPVTLQNREHSGLVRYRADPLAMVVIFWLGSPDAQLPPNIRLVTLNCAAQFIDQWMLTHCEPNPMEHEPSRAIGNFLAIERRSHSMKLVRAHALFGGAQEMNCIHPFVHRNVRVLEDGAHFCGEGLAASLALPEAGASALSL